MVFALSTTNKIGLGVAALIWVIVSLVVSMVIPRSRPDFPGKNLPAFVALMGVCFVGMLGAVFVFGKETHGAEASPGAPAHTNTGVSETAPTGGGHTPGGTADLAAGKAAWDKGSCGGCHILKAANGTGAVGPDLDKSTMDLAATQRQVENGSGAMPPFRGVLTPDEITAVSEYVVAVRGKS